MDPLRPTLLSRPTSVHPKSPSPPPQPSNDDIEAVIQMATSARQTPDGRSVPIKDTRTQLFVGNLPYRVRWQDLKDLFRRAGTVLRADVSLGPDNRSRGYGTVLLATAEDAGRAIDMFHGYSWQTRILEVRPDRLPPDFDNPPPISAPNPLPPSTAFATPSSATLASPLTSAILITSPPRSVRTLSEDLDYSAFFPAEPANAPSSSTYRNLFVGNLPFHCQWQDLKDLFRQAGTIIRADVALGPDGRSRGFGTVVFATEQDAERAVKMFNGYEYNGRALKVHVDRYSQLNQPSASPTHGTFHQAMSTANLGQPSFTTTMTSRPNHITLPIGYHSEFLPPSGPPSPYDLYHTHLSMFSSQSQSQQQEQVRLLSRSQHQQRPELVSPQPPTQDINDSKSLNELDSVTTRLASTSLSTTTTTKPGPISPPQQSKKSVQLNRSSNATSSDNSLSNSASTPAQLDSKSHQKMESDKRSPATIGSSSTTFSPSQSQQHPHHPGPISLPPPTLSFVAPPTLSPLHQQQLHLHHHHHSHLTGMPITISPLHHPNMGSPLHHPSTYAAAASNTQQIVPMTPHGLPPITPSMPPFIFHPIATPASPVTATGSGISSSAVPAHMSTAANMYGGTTTTGGGGGGLPSFSPTVAMSPGAFWGRPGNHHPNPFINPTVGAPVHLQQAPIGTSVGGDGGGGGGGGDQPLGGGGGTGNVNVNVNMNMSIGGSAYFYAPPGPGRVEPTGYFDPVYLPSGSHHSLGQPSGLSRETLKEEEYESTGDEFQREGTTTMGSGACEDATTTITTTASSSDRHASPTNDHDEDADADPDDIIGRSTSQDSTSVGTNTTCTMFSSGPTSWYNSEESGDEERERAASGNTSRRQFGTRSSGGYHKFPGGSKSVVGCSGWPAPAATVFASLSSQYEEEKKERG